MSHGLQLRQYHDYQTIAKHLNYVIDNWTKTNSTINFNGKEWIRLKDLAKEVFSFFKKECLLEIGKLESNQNELVNLEDLEVGPYNFPDAIPTIIEYLKRVLDEKVDFAILGGGLAGLGFYKGLGTGIIFEKDSRPGGHIKSKNIQGYTFDQGAHICHSKDPEWLEMIISTSLDINEKRSNVLNLKEDLVF